MDTLKMMLLLLVCCCVTSLCIDRDVNVLASIATDNRPITYNGTDPHSVVGSINQNSATDYLQLTWIEPKISDVRQYTCLIEAMDLLGHVLRFETTVSVPVQLPSVVDLLSYAEHLETLVNSMMPQMPHYEEGLADCPMSTTYTQVPQGEHLLLANEIIYRVPITFKTPYARKPVVFVSPVYVDVAKEHNTRYYTYVENLTENGFQIVCGTWWDSMFYELKVHWVSMAA